MTVMGVAISITSIVMIALLGVFRIFMKKSYFNFRNICMLALLTAVALFDVALVFESLVHKKESLQELCRFVLAWPEYFAQFAMIGLSILCFLMFISNLSLVKHEGFRPTNFVGTFLEAIFILGTIVIYILTELFGRDTFFSLLLYSLIDYYECMMIGIMIMGAIAARQKPVYDKDFIIIPGCSISKTGGLLPLLRGRVNRAIKYAWSQEIATGKRVYFVPSGGQGTNEIMSEGSAMGLYLLSHAAEEYEVFPEKESKNTRENFLFSKRIIETQNPNAKVAFATTNYHLLRCGMIAHKIGLETEGIASKTKWYFWPNGFAREVVAIFSMTRKYHIIATAIIIVIVLGIRIL